LSSGVGGEQVRNLRSWPPPAGVKVAVVADTGIEQENVLDAVTLLSKQLAKFATSFRA
jgi:hypothetical protein